MQGTEYHDCLTDCLNDESEIKDKYSRLRAMLERMTTELIADELVRYSNLFSRLSRVCLKTGLNGKDSRRIHSFRVRANKVLRSGYAPSDEEFRRDLRAIAVAVSRFYSLPLPEELSSLTTGDEELPVAVPAKKLERMRVNVVERDESFLYAFDEDNPTEEPVRIRYDVENVNRVFTPGILALRGHCQMNLIDVAIDGDGVYLPEIIIVEPDYLTDISALAECVKDYGSNHMHFFKTKFESVKTSAHILLGNAANLFLDEFVNEKPDAPVVYEETIAKVFKSAPLEFSVCQGIGRDFFDGIRSQFDNIRRIVNTLLPAENIDGNNAALEPHFICEHLGVQGRLDFLQLSDSRNVVIELKSGKAPYPESDYSLVGQNHRIQAFLYQIVIQKVLGVPFNKLDTYILYSRYADPKANLRFAKPYISAIKEVLNLRNMIAATEKAVALDKTGAEAEKLLASLTPENMLERTAFNSRFIDNYIAPQIIGFRKPFDEADALERAYFLSFYSFVAREHFLSKTGCGADCESVGSVAALRLLSGDEKKESGDILPDLTVTENNSDNNPPSVAFRIPERNRQRLFLPNFRLGDIVILYERNSDDDNATGKRIFKGVIEALSPDGVTVRLRFRQRNSSVFLPNRKYAVEHDFLDSSFNAMYKALYSFLQADGARRDLLLNRRAPRHDASVALVGRYLNADIDRITLKAKQARDYFLLTGPPGTGKTSIALRAMVEEFHADENVNILLLAYTNRAVDEICDALDSIAVAPPYLRIGSELSSRECHRNKLLDKVLAPCRNRDEVKAAIGKHRIFVGTTASVSGKLELFRVKHFHVAIVDEASQILEPQIIGILSAEDADGNSAIDKFIMIGDYKQLPAVVMQSSADSRVDSPELSSIGLTDRRNSLFERLCRLNENNGAVSEMLNRQGRMHPEICEFPNREFYRSRLESCMLPHQVAPLEFTVFDPDDALESLFASSRLAFFHAERGTGKSNKINVHEARIVAEALRVLHGLYLKNNLYFDVRKSIGVITPYRSQIALLKNEINRLNVPELNDVTVDTVERYQGSQRDIIIYSFCVNHPYQMDLLANIILDDNVVIDRKLNVALTRARKQLFLTGNSSILYNNAIYRDLINSTIVIR